MVRTLSAVALFALAGAALACDGARSKWVSSFAPASPAPVSSFAPDDGVPDKVAAFPASTATAAKDNAGAAALPSEPVKKQQAAPKRQPKGKPLGS